ncbi:MAG TPA: M48 family metalloprotease [Chitinophagales bacterium]|nr:M48 family metalloprotease [Chitinophagales bacterium]
MKSLPLAICLLIAAQSFAQNTHSRVTNTASLPTEVYTPSTEKFKNTVFDLPDTLSKRERMVREQYYLESGFGIDEMMRSGVVLYNTEYNAYLDKIADHLLRDNTELRMQLHFYILRSPVVNAFAGAGGNIFISMGLLAMLENEAELAFVMGHEIGHIALEHGLEFYVKANEIDKNSDDNALFKRSSSFDISSIAKNLYSQDLEKSADLFGIDLLLKSKYVADTNTLNAVFDVLKFAYLPYEDQPFPIDFFEGPHYAISKNLILDSIKQISGTPELPSKKESLKSTHPSIGERRKIIREKLLEQNGRGNQYYVVSEASFKNLRDDSRYTLPMYYLHNQFFQDAIYLSYLGLQRNPDDANLKKVIAKALTGYTKFRNSKEETTYAEKARFEDYEGQQQQLYFLLWAMYDVEFNVMSLLYTFQLHLDYPDDPEILPLCQTLVNDLVYYHFNDEDDFKIGETISRDSLYLLSDIANPKLKVAPPSKTSKVKTRKASVRSKRTSQEKIQKDKYKKHLLYAYNDFWDNKDFRNLWNEAVIARDEREAEAKELRESGFKIKDLGDKRNYYINNNLDVDSIVIVNPFYTRIDLRKDNAVEYVSSEEGEINFLEIVEANAAKVGMQVTIIDPLRMDANATEQFNDMQALNDWFSEQLDFGSMNMPGYEQALIDSLSKAYGTPYFMWTGIVSLRTKQKVLGPVLSIVFSPVFFPLLPYGIYELISPEYEFFYLSLLYNVNTHEADVLKFTLLKRNDSQAILNSHTYEMLYRLSSAKK